jgi:hypothetical protein
MYVIITLHKMSVYQRISNELKFHYVIVRHDSINTRESTVIGNAFTDSRNALSALEEYVFSYVNKEDGAEHAYNVSQKGSESYGYWKNCMFNARDQNDQEFAVVNRKNNAVSRKHYIIRDAARCPNKFTIYRKHDVIKIVPGKLWGSGPAQKTVFEAQFSVEVIKIPVTILSIVHDPPTVIFKKKWYKEISVDIYSEDECIEIDRIDVANAFSELIMAEDHFKYLASRLEQEEIDYINVPLIRYTYPDEFNECPRSTQYKPALFVAVVEVAPVVEVAVEVTDEIAAVEVAEEIVDETFEEERAVE